MTSAPACSAARASATVQTFANQAMLRWVVGGSERQHPENNASRERLKLSLQVSDRSVDGRLRKVQLEQTEHTGGWSYF